MVVWTDGHLIQVDQAQSYYKFFFGFLKTIRGRNDVDEGIHGSNSSFWLAAAGPTTAHWCRFQSTQGRSPDPIGMDRVLAPNVMRDTMMSPCHVVKCELEG